MPNKLIFDIFFELLLGKFRSKVTQLLIYEFLFRHREFCIFHFAFSFAVLQVDRSYRNFWVRLHHQQD